MNIHLPAMLMFTRGTRFWHTAIWLDSNRSSIRMYGLQRCFCLRIRHAQESGSDFWAQGLDEFGVDNMCILYIYRYNIHICVYIIHIITYIYTVYTYDMSICIYIYIHDIVFMNFGLTLDGWHPLIVNDVTNGLYNHGTRRTWHPGIIPFLSPSSQQEKLEETHRKPTESWSWLKSISMGCSPLASLINIKKSREL